MGNSQAPYAGGKQIAFPEPTDDPGRHCFLDGQEPDLLGPVLSTDRQDRRVPAQVLRPALPDGRGGLELLRDPGAADGPALGATHPSQFRLQRKGVPAFHWPPNTTEGLPEGHPGSARTAPYQERLSQGSP